MMFFLFFVKKWMFNFIVMGLGIQFFGSDFGLVKYSRNTLEHVELLYALATIL